MALRHLAGPFKFDPPHRAGGKTYFVFNIFADEDNNDAPHLLTQGWTDAQIQRGEHWPNNWPGHEPEKTVPTEEED